jgi:hypothetical protein
MPRTDTEDKDGIWGSSIGGSVHSAWVEGGTTLGSSSGAAVSVAAGYCPIAIGTDTFGSSVSLFFLVVLPLNDVMILAKRLRDCASS